MFELMQSVLLVFIEIMCCNIFYETFGKARYKGWINAIQFILLLCSTYILVYVFSKHFLIRQIAVILNFSVFMLWHVKISMKKSFVLAILFYALLLAMDSLAFLIVQAGTGLPQTGRISTCGRSRTIKIILTNCFATRERSLRYPAGCPWKSQNSIYL